MRNIITLALVAILAISSVYAGGMQLQLGSSVARSRGTSGSFAIVCSGGSGNYEYNFNGLPAGWTQNNNYITVPSINYVNGQTFNIGV